jgi:hypothetical protein
MRVFAELGIALRDLTVLGRGRSPTDGALRAPALAWYPLVGIGLGAVAAAVARGLPGGAGGPVGVVVLALLAGRVDRAAVAGVAVRATIAALLPPGALGAALLLAPMLGAWAMTVQSYGAGSGGVRAGFREFGIASVTAFGVTLAVGELVGLIVVVAAALVTTVVRVVAHREPGWRRHVLGASREAVETTTFVVLALLGIAARA